MKGIQRIISLMLLSTLSLTSINAQTPSTPTDKCKSCTEPKKKEEVRLDALDCGLTGDTRFRTRQIIHVVVTNVNPFLYEYELVLTPVKVSEPAITAFLPFVGGVAGQAAGGEQNALQQPPPERFSLEDALAAASACSDINRQTAIKSELGLLDKLKRNAQTDRDSITSGIDGTGGLNERHGNTKNAYEKHRKELLNPSANCQTLCENSDELIKTMEGSIKDEEITKAKSKITVLRDKVAGIKKQITEIRTQFADCLSRDVEGKPVREFLNDREDIAKGLLSDAAASEATLQGIEKELKTFRKTETDVRAVLAQPYPFQIRKQTGDFDSSTDVGVELKRKLLGSTETAKAVCSTKLKFGDGPFFTLSGGVVFSPLAKQEIDKIQGFPLDRQGVRTGDPVTTVIGLKEQSDTRISPVVMLSGRLWTPKDMKAGLDGIHISLGLTAKNDGQNTNVEFLVGPSLSFLDRQLFLTAGGYAGRQQKLAGDFYLGQKIDPATAITVQRNYCWHFGAAITYKIK